MSRNRVLILIAAFVVGCFCARAVALTLGDEVTVVKQPVRGVKFVTIASDSPTVVPVTVRTRLVRPVAVSPLATLEVEKREAPAYKIVEQEKTPFVVRGLYRDRVVIPKRPVLTVEPR